MNCGGKCKPKDDDELAMCRVCRLRKKHKPRVVAKKATLQSQIKKERNALEKSAIEKQDSMILNLANEYRKSQNRKDLWPRMKSMAINITLDWFRFYVEGRTKTEEVTTSFKMLTEDEIQVIKMKALAMNVVANWFRFYMDGKTKTDEVLAAFEMLTEEEIQAIKRTYINN